MRPVRGGRGVPGSRRPRRPWRGRRAGPGGEQLAGAAAQVVLAVAAVQVPVRAEQVVAYAGLRIGGAQDTQDALGGVRLPVDAALALAQERPGRAGLLGARDVRTGGEALHGEQDGLQRGVGDLAAVEVALADGWHRAVGGGPDVAGVHLGVGLQDRDPPSGLAVLDGPVEGGGAAVAEGSGVDDEAGVRGPDVLGDGGAQHRREDEVGVVAAYGLGQRVAGPGQFDRHPVAVVAQLGVDSLGEAVERARDEQDVHVGSRRRPGAAVVAVPGLFGGW